MEEAELLEQLGLANEDVLRKGHPRYSRKNCTDVFSQCCRVRAQVPLVRRQRHTAPLEQERLARGQQPRQEGGVGFQCLQRHCFEETCPCYGMKMQTGCRQRQVRPHLVCMGYVDLVCSCRLDVLERGGTLLPALRHKHRRGLSTYIFIHINILCSASVNHLRYSVRGARCRRRSRSSHTRPRIRRGKWFCLVAEVAKQRTCVRIV